MRQHPHVPAPARRGLADRLARTLLRRGVPPILLASDIAVICLVGTWMRLAVADLTVLIGGFIVAGAAQRLYRSRLAPSALDDMSTVAATAGLATATLAVARTFEGTVALTSHDVRGVLAIGLLVLTGRALAYAAVRAGRRRRLVTHRTLIVGAGLVGERLARSLREDRRYGLEPVGFLDRDPLLPPSERSLAVLGAPDDLSEVVTRLGVKEVVIAFGSQREKEVVDIVRDCDRLDCEVFFVPRLFDLHGRGRAYDNVNGIPLVRLPRAARRTNAWRLKRVTDIVVASFVGILMSPVMAACALAVRLDSGKGVLFRQERIGVDGRPFMLLKFRTIRPANEAESATRWSVAGDHRLSRVGRILRSTSLDELPQLWNILRGDMTLVGPRPERPFFVDRFSEEFDTYALRHRVPAGLTGWAQVHGLRGATSIEERARFDNAYIDNWSLSLDAKILLRTLTSMVRRDGS